MLNVSHSLYFHHQKLCYYSVDIFIASHKAPSTSQCSDTFKTVKKQNVIRDLIGWWVLIIIIL